MSGARGSLGVGVGREEPKQDSGDVIVYSLDGQEAAQTPETGL
jgi:hypothetical protein